MIYVEKDGYGITGYVDDSLIIDIYIKPPQEGGKSLWLNGYLLI